MNSLQKQQQAQLKKNPSRRLRRNFEVFKDSRASKQGQSVPKETTKTYSAQGINMNHGMLHGGAPIGSKVLLSKDKILIGAGNAQHSQSHQHLVDAASFVAQNMAQANSIKNKSNHSQTPGNAMNVGQNNKRGNFNQVLQRMPVQGHYQTNGSRGQSTQKQQNTGYYDLSSGQISNLTSQAKLGGSTRHHSQGARVPNSNTQTQQNLTLYSQISLKEIPSPVKMLNMSKKQNPQGHYGKNNQSQMATGMVSKQSSTHYLPPARSSSQQHNNTQQFMQLADGPAQTVSIINGKRQQNVHPLQQAMTGTHSKGSVEFRGYNVVSLGPQLQQHPSVGDSRSRNGQFAHTSSGNQTRQGSEAAILNINTAQDINIYNNSFIVNTNSAANKVVNSNNSRSNSIKRSSRNANNQGVQRINKVGQNKLNQERQGSHQHLKSEAHLSQRSLSQGRGQKHGQSVRLMTEGSNQKGQPYLNKQRVGNKAQAIQEAYHQNPAYLNKKGLTGQRNNSQGATQSPSQPWKGQVIQMINSKPLGQQQRFIKQSRTSTELKGQKEFNQVQNLNFRPQYNNLIDSEQQYQKLVNQSLSKKSIQSKESIGDPAVIQNQSVTSFQDIDKKGKQRFERVRKMILKGKQKLQAKDYNEAIRIFTQILDDVDSENIDATFYRAISYLDQGNLQQAISELWRVANNQNNKSKQQLAQQSYILLSIAHKRLGESQNAIQDLDKCIETFPDYPDAYLARGQSLLIAEDFQKALTDFKKYNSYVNDSFVGLVGIGDCHKALKRQSDAIEAYTKSIKLIQNKKAASDQIIHVQMKRALACFLSGQYSMALTDFQAVIKEDTQNVKAHFYIGKILAKGVENSQSKVKDAILHFEQVAKYPDHEFYAGNALFQIAKLRLKQKDYYEAYFALKRASDNNFASKKMTLYRDFTEGVLYLIKRKIKKGVQILSDLLEILINKENDKAKKKDKDKDKESKEEKVEKKTQSASDKAHADYLIHQIYIFRAYGYVAIEKYELAQEDIKKLKQYGKSDPATIYNKWLGKGILRMDHEDYLMASKYFTKAWKKFPSNKDSYCLQVISIVRSYTYSLAGYNIDQSIKIDKVMQTKRFLDKAITNCNQKQKEPSLYFFRGLLYFHLHMFYEALQDFNIAIEEEEESTAFFFLARGRTYACLSILTEAMKDLSVALNLDESLQQGYIYRGKCAYLLGDNNLAFLDFQRLILTDPKNPLVHVYAGNLLMTTGAYTDAIKAFENADTVEPTAVSAFQRVRCYCALTDLENAKNMMQNAIQACPEDIILQYDSHCLDQLHTVAQVTKLQCKKDISAGEIKTADAALSKSIKVLNELIATFESDKVQSLKKRDGPLNIQLIPNVERIKVEKVAVAKDLHKAKLNAPEDQRKDFPSLTIDPDEPSDLALIKRMKNVSYYYENIFSLEDFYLYRGVMHFYSQKYKDALIDFQRAQLAHKASEGKGGDKFDTKNESSLQMYTVGKETHSPGASVNSHKTDLSDVGLCSFNSNETTYNMLLCYLFLNDKENALQKLSEMFQKLPKRYSQHFGLLRALILDHFNLSEKAAIELKKYKQQEPKVYDQFFMKGHTFLYEPFPSDGRLCQIFYPVPLRLASKGIAKGVPLTVRPSFSMPFIKPPNMIPNVDEDAIQGEFNLKQIDAPMPEAPWVKLCAHGITFTNDIQQDPSPGKADYYKKYFGEPKASADLEKSFKPQDLAVGNTAAGARLLDNLAGETVSDKNKISLMEDSRIWDEVCDQADCLLNVAQTKEYFGAGQKHKKKHSQKESNNRRDLSKSDSCIIQSGDEEYDSETDSDEEISDIQMGAADLGAPVIDRDSMPNLGANMTKELRQQRKLAKGEAEQYEVGLKESDRNLIGGGLLPNSSAQKRQFENTQTGRYDAQQSDADGEAIPITNNRRGNAVPAEPHGLENNMLEGERKKKRKERRVSNLSIGMFNDDNEGEQRSSLFRSRDNADKE